jgi:hypothetical protein
VSVQYAMVVLMTDTHITRDDISHEAYAAVAARRAHFDQLLWQVPVISLAGQAFLFSIALSPETARTSKIIASFLAVVMTFLSLHLMVKHRQAEVADSQWLEAYENEFAPPVGVPAWPMHGPTWASYRKGVDPNIGRLDALSKLPGFRTWTWGIAAFGVASIIVFVLAIVMPSWLGSS